MKPIARVFWALAWLGALLLAGAIVLTITASRVGQHKSSTYGQAYQRFQQDWGGEIGIHLPKFYLEHTWEEQVYNSSSKQYETKLRAQSIPLTPERIVIRTTVDYGEQKRGLLTFNAFEALTEETYIVPNLSGKEGRVLAQLARPDNANFLYDYVIYAGEDEQPLSAGMGAEIAVADAVARDETTQLKIVYRTKGMDVLRYNLAAYKDEVVAHLDAEMRLNTDRFEVLRFGMPHQIEATADGAVLRFAMEDFSTTQDLGVAFDSKAMYLDQIQNLITYSPIALALWLVVIFVFSQIKRIRFNGLHYLFIGALPVFYFLFVSYLIRFFGIWLTFGLATGLTALMFVLYCPNVLGWPFAKRIAAPYLAVLTVLFSSVFLMPIFQGILFVTLCFVVFMTVMIAVSRSVIGEWPILQSEAEA